MSLGLGVAELWSAAGVIAGFQIMAFSWRVSREVAMAGEGERIWFPIADMINLLSLLVTLLGVYVAGALDLIDLDQSIRVFGWAVLLLACWPVAVLGHYDLLRLHPRKTADRPYFTLQELLVFLLAGALSVTYWKVAS